MKVRISKMYRGQQHVGFKKTVGGRECYLAFGTGPADEAKAMRLAECLEARWTLAKATGARELSQTDYEEVKALVLGGPRWSDDVLARHGIEPVAPLALARQSLPEASLAVPAVTVPSVPVSVEVLDIISAPASGQAPSVRWLYQAIDDFVLWTKTQLKADGSNEDHVFNTCDRILRARELVNDMPLDRLRRKELDDWLTAIRNAKSKTTGKVLAAPTVRNLAQAVRQFLTKAGEWEWWTGPDMWVKAFNGYSIKKLMTREEKQKRKQKPPRHTVAEKRILWKLADPFTKAVIALSDWAGHTQKECATLRFQHIREIGGEMFIVRDRWKTGVPGRWWVPPEPAAAIRQAIGRTPRDSATNPDGLALLTPRKKPLVSRRTGGRRTRNDYICSSVWKTLLLAAAPYGVRKISYKYNRKATAQLIRNLKGKEVSRTFLAHADEDVQDEAYTRASFRKLERASRAIYEKKYHQIYEPFGKDHWGPLIEKIAAEHEQRENKKRDILGQVSSDH